MKVAKPTLPKGTRDFLPEEMRKRQYIFNIIESHFKKFGFLPVETPAQENLSVLSGKYGEEGDQLMFRILNSGDFLKDISPDSLTAGYKNLLPNISEKALRYDLTVPFARMVVMHQHEINFPFKRYQIQPVWRADRPQKGRYREFYQCDADVIGSDSLLLEAELITLYFEIFSALNLKVNILLNNRKILTALSIYLGIPEQLTEFTIILDKLDKIGIAGVVEAWNAKGFPESVGKAFINLDIKSSSHLDFRNIINRFQVLFSDIPVGLEGLSELITVWELLPHFNTTLQQHVSLDFTLARGLNYYTGAILEVKSLDTEMGSIGGGGRYDNLTGLFGLPGISGMGISLGADRIYDVIEAAGKFPEHLISAVQVLLIYFDDQTLPATLKVLQELRNAGISAEIYPDQKKIGKQYEFAAKKNIPWVGLIGPSELSTQTLKVKYLPTGAEYSWDIPSFLSEINKAK